MKLDISELAQKDLIEIGEYLFQLNPEAAERLLKTFREKFDMLTKFPNMGKERNELVIGWRSFPVGKYVIFYQIHEDVLEIIRVRHASTDIDNLFEDFSA